MEQVAIAVEDLGPQVVALRHGLMARPRLLLMDEPSAGLARKLVERLAAILEQIDPGRNLDLAR